MQMEQPLSEEPTAERPQLPGAKAMQDEQPKFLNHERRPMQSHEGRKKSGEETKPKPSAREEEPPAALKNEAYSLSKEREMPGAQSAEAPLDMITKRDIEDLEVQMLQPSKRVKGPDSSSDIECSALPLRAQKNKLTNYFKVANPKPATSKAENFSAVEFKQFNEGTVNRPVPTQFELLLSEKDREISGLNLKIQELLHYKQKAKLICAEQLLNLENKRRIEEKNWILAERQALGEFVTMREGSRFREVWIDGVELAKLKESLVKIQAEKESAERRRKQIKRKQKPGESCDKRETLAAAAAQKGSYFNAIGAELSDSNSFSMVPERGLDEMREHLNSQILYLTREENGIKEKIEQLERRKEVYIAANKHLIEEENSRFGRLTVTDRELKWPLMNNRYQILSLLGKGGFSEVYRGYDVDELRNVACKIHQLSPNWSETVKSNYIKHILRETNVHKSISHPNVVAHYDTVEIDSNSFCTVLEYCNGSDLGAYLKKHKVLNEKDAKLIIKQVFAALKFLNENQRKVIHYDLKPQNILFHNGIVKISDFGLCKVMNSNETNLELTSQGVGTYWYLPPECFLPEGAKISTKVDVWSAGVVFFEMLYGFRPFGNEATQERIWKEGIMLKANTLDFPLKPIVSLETREFLKKCLVYNQEERIDVLEASALLNK